MYIKIAVVIAGSMMQTEELKIFYFEVTTGSKRRIPGRVRPRAGAFVAVPVAARDLHRAVQKTKTHKERKCK